MATDPAYAATVKVGSALLPATLDTSLTAPANTSTVLTAGSNGTKVESITFQAVGTTAAGVVNVFRYDGATYHLIDQVQVPVVTSATTAVGFSVSRSYPSLFLASGDTLRVTGTIAGNQSMIKVTAFAGDF